MDQELVDALDRELDFISAEDPSYSRRLRELGRACRESGFLPTRYVLQKKPDNIGDNPVSYGGSADVWKAEHEGKLVAVKVIRMHHEEQAKMRRMFYEEVVLWKRLRHPNIVPFLGTSPPSERLSIVSEWMVHGDLSAYAKDRVGHDKLKLVINLASALDFVHSCQVVHGDIKGRNVMVNERKEACLTDFGIAIAAYNTQSLNVALTRDHLGGTPRWAPPERLMPGQEADAAPSKAGDIYSFGLTMWEVYSGQVPFYDIRADYMLVPQIMNGLRPLRPDHVSDVVWGVMVECWAPECKVRPNSRTVLNALQDESVQTAGSIHSFWKAQAILNNLQTLHDDFATLVGTLDVDKYLLPQPRAPQEPLYPAHLAMLVVREQWRRELFEQSTAFLADFSQLLKDHVASLHSDKLMLAGAFWLSNAREIHAYLAGASNDVSMNVPPVKGLPSVPIETWRSRVASALDIADEMQRSIFSLWSRGAQAALTALGIVALIGNIKRTAKSRSSDMEKFIARLDFACLNASKFLMEEDLTARFIKEILTGICTGTFNNILKQEGFPHPHRAAELIDNIERLSARPYVVESQERRRAIQLRTLFEPLKHLCIFIQTPKDDASYLSDALRQCGTLTPSQIRRLYTISRPQVPLGGGWLAFKINNNLVSTQERMKYYATGLMGGTDFLTALEKHVRINENTKGDRLWLPEHEPILPIVALRKTDMSDLHKFVPDYVYAPHLRGLIAVLP